MVAQTSAVNPYCVTIKFARILIDSHQVAWTFKAVAQLPFSNNNHHCLLNRSPQIRTWTVTTLLCHLLHLANLWVSLSCANSPLRLSLLWHSCT